MLRKNIFKAFHTSVLGKSTLPKSAFGSLKVISPYTLEVIHEQNFLKEKEGKEILKTASKAQKSWSQVSLAERIEVCRKSAEYFEKNADRIATEISNQMGKPLSQAQGEVKTLSKRVHELINLAPLQLEDQVIKQNENGYLKIKREPVGVVLLISPWNYPLITAVNTLVAAVLSGNTVLLKHSPITPLCGKAFQDAFEYAGVNNIVNDFMIDVKYLENFYSAPEIGYVSFTGSVNGGRYVNERVAEKRFIDVGLELGGKDAAYVAEDSNIKEAADSLVDGAMYNAGQSCCSIERIYVHQSKYEEFLEEATKITKGYVLGDPLKSETSMGPLTLEDTVAKLQAQAEEAVNQGARLLCGGMPTVDKEGKGRFFEPTLLANAENDMVFMIEESFGPIVGINSVVDDDMAVKLINDSKYGLTASVYTKDAERAARISEKLDVGTVFMNRCDFLEPLLPWSGRKDSGKGISLSKYGFHAVTRTKGYNFVFKK